MSKFIKATRTIETTYDLEQIMKDYNCSEDEARQQIEDYAVEDLSCGYGHTCDVDEIEFIEVEGDAQ